MNTQQALKILGLKPGASMADVQRAFRARVKRYHPDSGAQPNPLTFQAIMEAWRHIEKEMRPRESRVGAQILTVRPMDIAFGKTLRVRIDDETLPIRLPRDAHDRQRIRIHNRVFELRVDQPPRLGEALRAFMRDFPIRQGAA